MINDVKKLASCVSNRPKAIKSFNILIELINGSIKEVPNVVFITLKQKQMKNLFYKMKYGNIQWIIRSRTKRR